MTLTLPVILLLVCIVLCVLLAIPKLGRGWMLPIALACFAASFLVVKAF